MIPGRPNPRPPVQVGVTRLTTPQSSDSERLQRIERLVEGIASDVAVLKDDMVTVRRDVAVLQRDVAVMQRDVAGLQRDMAVLQRDMAGLQRDVAVMKGWQTELAVERRARDVFRRLCRGHLLRMYPDAELHHYLRERTNAGTMSSDEASRAESIDFLMEGTGSSGTPVMYAVEASYTSGIRDTDRAIEKATLLTGLLGREVKPAVVGEVFTTGFEADANIRNVAYTHISNGHEIVR